MKSANAKNSSMNSSLALVVALCLLAVATVRAETVKLSTLFGDYTATNGTTLNGTLSENYKISVADGATITLDRVTIRGVNNANYPWAGLTCEGDATIVLSGKNTLQGFFSSYPGIYVHPDKTLIIRGDGSLTASGNGNSAGIGGGFRLACGNIVIEGGSITATGGWGAGTGGGYNAPCGEIRITGGNVSATGGNGSAGIGGGYNAAETNEGACDNIIIGGGTVTAKGGENGAGIGGGNKVSCGNISLTGGIINASGGKNAAGIGGGWMASCGDIAIGFGIDTLVATMGESATPIGEGYGGSCGTVSVADGLNDMSKDNTRKMTSWDGYLAAVTHDIAALDGMTLYGTLTGNYKVSIADGSTVTLEGITIIGRSNYYDYQWAGLSCEGDATIVISGVNTVNGFYNSPGIQVPDGHTLTIRGTGSLTASGSSYSAGIGSGAYAHAGDIIIEGGVITATGGYRGAGIGGGGNGESSGNCGNIVITGGTITATGNDGAAGIGGGYDRSCGNISIMGGNIVATNNGEAAGVGSGPYGTCGIISITNATLIAMGGNSSAGIGCGPQGICSSISIMGGKISAQGGNSAAGIGSGYRANYSNSFCGDITIIGGEIDASGGKNGAGIGGGLDAPCGNIALTGGEITAKGGDAAAGIGGGSKGNCNDITIGADIICVTATKGGATSPTPIGKGAGSTCGTISIAGNLEQIQSADGATLTLQPGFVTITWLDDAGSEIDTTSVSAGVVPTHSAPLPTQTAEAPYRYVFTGWSPDPVAAMNDATYMATFSRVADLSLLDGDWSPADGDVILSGTTPYTVTIPPGISVTIDGVAIATDGTSSSDPVFADGGAGLLTGFVPSEDGTWTLEAYGNLASGTAEGVTPDMVQVYAADSVEDLATADPLTSGVTLKDTQNAVKATLEVTPPSTSDTQFFRVQFSAE